MASLIPYIYKDSNQSFLCTDIPLHYLLLLASADIPPVLFRKENSGRKMKVLWKV